MIDSIEEVVLIHLRFQRYKLRLHQSCTATGKAFLWEMNPPSDLMIDLNYCLRLVNWQVALATLPANISLASTAEFMALLNVAMSVPPLSASFK